MAKNKKKITYRQLMNYILSVEYNTKHALNTISKTISDYIHFKGQEKEFMNFLKEKYKGETDGGKEKTVTKKTK